MSPMRAETATETTPIVTAAMPAAQDMAFERCETCGHRAYVMVMTAGGALAFCAHHYERNAIALAGISSVIHDIREQLVRVNRAKD